MGIARDNAPRTLEEHIRVLTSRIERLELRVLPRVKPGADEAVFSFAGVPVVDLVSPPYAVPAIGSVSRVIVSAETAGTSTTTVSLHVNGVAAATVSLLSGVKSIAVETNLPVEDLDLLTVSASAVGSGVKGLVVQALVTARKA